MVGRLSDIFGFCFPYCVCHLKEYPIIFSLFFFPLPSPVWHAPHASALPHPQKPTASAQVQEVVSVQQKLQPHVVVQLWIWLDCRRQVQEIFQLHRGLLGKELHAATSNRPATETPFHPGPAQRAAGPHPAQGPHWPHQEEERRKRCGSLGGRESEKCFLSGAS